MPLTADRTDEFHWQILTKIALPMAAEAVVYRGAAVSADAAGYVIPAADTAAQANRAILVSLEYRSAVNKANGEVWVECILKGTVVFPIDPGSPLTQADLLKDVHFQDDGLAANTSVNNRIAGRLLGIEADRAIIELR